MLSLGKDGNRLRDPIVISLPDYFIPFGTPSKVEIGWRKGARGGGYEVRCTYTRQLVLPGQQVTPVGEVGGCDQGEVHPFVITSGWSTTIYNGGILRSKRRYRNKVQGHLDEIISRTKPGSKRRRKLVKSKQRQLRKLNCQIRDIEHKLTTRAVSDLLEAGVKELAIGDLRSLRQNSPSSSKATKAHPTKGRLYNQRIHQAPLGRNRHYLIYKCHRVGIQVPPLVNERETTMTCPRPGCGGKIKPSNRVYRCKRCGLRAHRDAVGSWNIRAKYLGIEPWGTVSIDENRVVGAVAAPIGVKYRPHMRVLPQVNVAGVDTTCSCG